MIEGGQDSEPHRTIERVARESYGRLVAYLSSHTRDVASAEDALSNALVAALKTWPRDGVPQNPEAWLLTTARHSLSTVCVINKWPQQVSHSSASEGGT